VARAIVHELEVSQAREPVVYLDLTHLKAERIRSRFPRIWETCMQYNIDITTDMIPIRPAAHYAMGGVRTDLQGNTSLPGLFAAGEVAATGVHGANRLASNSLLEGVVFGARAGAAMRDRLRTSMSSPAGHLEDKKQRHHSSPELAPPQLENQIQAMRSLMWQNAGIVRDGKKLQHSIAELKKAQDLLPQPKSRREWEAHNIAINGMLIACSALARKESRGAHYRTDFPSHNDAQFKKHSIVNGADIRFT